MPESESARPLESRIARLEAIVERLDRDDLELQEAMDLFEEGVSHVREAYAVLEQTRLRVETLSVDPDGKVSLQPQSTE